MIILGLHISSASLCCSAALCPRYSAARHAWSSATPILLPTCPDALLLTPLLPQPPHALLSTTLMLCCPARDSSAALPRLPCCAAPCCSVFRPMPPTPLLPILLLLCCVTPCCFAAHPPALRHLPPGCPPSATCHPKPCGPVPCCSNAQHDPGSVLMLVQLHLSKHDSFVAILMTAFSAPSEPAMLCQQTYTGLQRLTRLLVTCMSVCVSYQK